MITELESTKEQLRRWKRIAAYLAECHAANAEGLPRSASKRERSRQHSICERAMNWMASDWMEPDHKQPDGEEVASAVRRCSAAAAALANGRDEPRRSEA